MESPPNQKKILLVEDTEDNRFMMRRLLEMDGYAVVEARNGQEAVTIARAEKPQAVFQVVALFRAEHQLLRAVGMALGRLVDFAKSGAAAAAQKIDGRVSGDAGKPVGGLLLVLQLFLVLEGLDKGLLSQILGIRRVPDDPVNLDEDPA